MSGYVVLGQEESGFWSRLRFASAESAEQAIRQVVGEWEGYDVFLAVPERSFRPLKVERTRVTQTKLAPVTPPSKEKPSDQ